MALAAIAGLLFGISVWLIAAGWLWQFWQLFQHLRDVPVLSVAYEKTAWQHVESKAGVPDLTVIVPARNEETAIESTLRSLLSSVDIRVQILAVDDRSSDKTGQIMDRVAVEYINKNIDHNIQIIHINKLADSWMGKPHALQSAARFADAKWLLFTDGDVDFAPEALDVALRYAETENADHLVVMPDWVLGTPGEEAMHGAIHALTSPTLRLWKVADPKARDFIGVGAFNLIRSEVFEELGGFEPLRMEVIEDMRLGWMVKRGGYRQRVVLGNGLVSVRWANGAWGVVRNLEKNLFATFRYRTGLASAAALALAAQIVWPIAALVAGAKGVYWIGTGGLVTYAAIAGVFFASRRVTKASPWYVVFFPLASSLFLFAMLRSMTLALLRGGVMWRGTLYPLKTLRAYAGRRW